MEAGTLSIVADSRLLAAVEVLETIEAHVSAHRAPAAALTVASK
jgi:hypothetical protein